MNSTAAIKKSKTIVIKIGSALIADLKKDTVRMEWLNTFVDDVKSLTKSGKNIVIVSSGAVALGRGTLGISPTMPPSKIPLEQKQAASAVGQFRVFSAYYEAFSKRGMKVAQALLTMSETENRRMHLNARGALGVLIEKGIIPIINENDTVSTGEIRFGDNDRLAVRVAQMIEADLVILLSTTDGFFTADPHKNPKAKHLPLVKSVTQEHMDMAGDAVPGLSTGGMKSKIEAALSATRSGLSLIIADGRDDHALKKLGSDEAKKSTLFAAQDNRINARKKWIQAHLKPKGIIIVDTGAAAALGKGKSLLPVGVKGVEGNFQRGDVVIIKSPEGKKLGSGLSAYNAEDAKLIMGKSSDKITEILGFSGRDELIHRNDMVLIAK